MSDGDKNGEPGSLRAHGVVVEEAEEERALRLVGYFKKKENSRREKKTKGERRKSFESHAIEAGTLGGLVAGGQHA